MVGMAELKRSLFICLAIVTCFILISQFNLFTWSKKSEESLGLTERAKQKQILEQETPTPTIDLDDDTPSFERDDLDMRDHHRYYLSRPELLPSPDEPIKRETPAERKQRIRNYKDFDRTCKNIVAVEFKNESLYMKQYIKLHGDPGYAEIPKGIRPLDLTHNASLLESTEWKNDSNKNPFLLPRPTLFIHMPKTAGTTMRHVILRNVDLGAYFHQDFQPRPEDMHLVMESNFMYGHMRYGLHTYYDRYYNDNLKDQKLRLPYDREDMQSPYSYIAIVRDPIKRVHSHYYYLKEHPDHPMHREVAKVNFTQWISKSPLANNEMCRRIVGIARTDKAPPNLLEQCLFRLKYSFKFIGLTEKFDETLVLMSHFLGFTDINYETRNEGKMKNENTLSDSDRDLIIKRNKEDIEMYKEATKIFEAEIDLLGREFYEESVKRFKNRPPTPTKPLILPTM